MPYLIDGHNLIPKIPGSSLEAIDDEIQLIEQLQEFCRLTQKRVEVFFDNAPPGQSGMQKFGKVTVYFVRQGRTADDAIQQRLTQLGKGARNWTVVSSDRVVLSAAKSSHTKTITSERFSKVLVQTQNEQPQGIEEVSEIIMSPEEIDQWLKLFGESDDPR
jgi:predicted RNA-binding protein with PIN domain